MNDTTTIAALATAPAPAGIAVVRISGPLTKKALSSLFRAKESPIKNPRTLVYGRLIDFKTKKTIDKCLAVYMPGPNSFTGEDIGEIQMHGSLLLVQKVLRSLYAFGVVPAEAGEFTKRAFLNGKMDLVQSEGISDMIQATTERSLTLANEQIDGRFSAALTEIGEPLRDVLAEIEAGLDFPEEDIEPDSIVKVSKKIKRSMILIRKLIGTYSYGHLVKDGYRVLLCGRPNAGKSSILNILLGKNRAIVTDIPGTTRDFIEEEATFSGYRFIFCDSAGLTNTDDKVEQIGIELAHGKLEWADLVLFVADATETLEKSSENWMYYLDDVRGKSKKLWLVLNKIDLLEDAVSKYAFEARSAEQVFYLSANTQDGLSTLKEALTSEIQSQINDTAEGSAVITNERHRNGLLRSAEALERALKSIESKEPLEIASSELRIALGSLDEIIGKTWTEDILGRIFSKFCIGK